MNEPHIVVEDDEEEENDEMEAAIQASLASFEKESKPQQEVVIDLNNETEGDIVLDDRAAELLRRATELEKSNEELRRRLMMVAENASIDLTGEGDNEDDELARAIKLSLQPNEPTAVKPTTMSDVHQGDKVGEGSTFFLNRIRGMSKAGNENTVTFKQIVQPDRLESALVTTFTLDTNWLLNNIPRDVPLTIIRHWERDTDKEGVFEISATCRVIHPPLLKWGNMHAKLMLLQYPGILRVVISSANLAREDWELVGQTVWLQDFPRKNQQGRPAPPTDSFGGTLYKFLTTMKADASLLGDYDFSGAKGELVISAPGWHKGTTLDSYGHMRLRSILSTFVWPPAYDDDGIDYQMSSVGSLHKSFVQEFIDSVCGKTDEEGQAKDKGKKKVAKRKITQAKKDDEKATDEGKHEGTRKRRRVEKILEEVENNEIVIQKEGKDKEKEKGEEEKSNSNKQPPFRIIYPSGEWVRSARFNSCAGMLMLQENNWNSPGFPKSAVHEIAPNVFFPGNPASRDGLVLHSKVLTRTVATKGGGRYGWVYAGSHNFSGAAWGRLQKNGKQLHISNYEIGIVLFSDDNQSGGDYPPWFKNIPFNIPPPPYEKGRTPFFL